MNASSARATSSVAAALGGGRSSSARSTSAATNRIPYLPLPAEENPALGLRGMRTSLWRPELLRVQLRAMLRCAGRAMP